MNDQEKHKKIVTSFHNIVVQLQKAKTPHHETTATKYFREKTKKKDKSEKEKIIKEQLKNGFLENDIAHLSYVYIDNKTDQTRSATSEDQADQTHQTIEDETQKKILI